MPLQTVAMFVLGTLAAGGALWVFIYPMLSGERRADQRQATIARQELTSVSPTARSSVRNRREQVEETLKEIDVRRKNVKSPPLSVRISRAGLRWSKRQFYVISGVLGVAVFGLVFASGFGLPPAVGAGFAGSFGLPRWILAFLKKRRERKFLHSFADSVDVIVRGVKAGLPLGDCLRIIATEAPEPVRSEFRTIVETQAIGIPLGEACAKLYESIPLPEA